MCGGDIKVVQLNGAVACFCMLMQGKIYIPTNCTLSQILHLNRSQNIIQYHDNNIWKQMCIKKVSYSTETYLQYNVHREKNVKKYMWALYHELFLFLQSSNCFCYVPDNDIKGDILVWTTSQWSLPTTTFKNHTEENSHKLNQYFWT